MIPLWITKNPQTGMIRWLSSAPPPGRQIREGLGCVPVQEFHLQGDQQVSGAWPAMGSAQEHAGLHAEEGQDGTWSTARNLAFHRCVLQRHSFMSVGNRYRQEGAWKEQEGLHLICEAPALAPRKSLPGKAASADALHSM